MQKQFLGGCALVVAAGVVASQFTADSHAGRKRRQKSKQITSVQPAMDAGVAGTGTPDVIVGSVNGVTNWASEIGPDGRTAYSFGTTSCNIGTAPLAFTDS